MRLQLFEFTDLKWYPGMLKRPIQDYLDFVSERFGLFVDLEGLLGPELQRLGENRVIDLGSGAGGGLLSVWRALKAHVPGLKVIQTDLFPGEIRDDYTQEGIEYREEPVDARSVPGDLRGFRTLFSVAHHLPPAILKEVIQDARRSGQGIAILEPVQKSVVSILGMLIVVPLLVLFLTPFIRPFRFSRLLFTYLVPIIPLTIVWDGVVSCLRAYSAADLLALAESTEGPVYIWKSGKHGRGAGVVYLVGGPALA